MYFAMMTILCGTVAAESKTKDGAILCLFFGVVFFISTILFWWIDRTEEVKDKDK